MYFLATFGHALMPTFWALLPWGGLDAPAKGAVEAEVLAIRIARFASN